MAIVVYGRREERALRRAAGRDARRAAAPVVFVVACWFAGLVALAVWP